jgi:hypothetical protein
MNRPYQRYRFTIKPEPTPMDAVRWIACMVLMAGGILYLHQLYEGWI